MREVVTPLPQYALSSGAHLKHRDNFTLPLTYSYFQVLLLV
jgi:hypothetical protein